MEQRLKTGTELKCQRCGKLWYYKGNNPFYAICSYCRTTVSIRKNRVQADAVIGVSHPPDQSQRGKPS